MDMSDLRGKIQTGLQKYRYAAIVVLAGILLMLLPGGRQEKAAVPEAPAALQQAESMEKQLSRLLSELEGAGRVQVLLSQAEGEKTVYEYDLEQSREDQRRKTVLVRTGSSGEDGLVRQINPPKYLGAVVLCQGGDLAPVRLAIVDAVTSLTGLSSDRVSVLKMK